MIDRSNRSRAGLASSRNNALIEQLNGSGHHQQSTGDRLRISLSSDGRFSRFFGYLASLASLASLISLASLASSVNSPSLASPAPRSKWQCRAHNKRGRTGEQRTTLIESSSLCCSSGQRALARGRARPRPSQRTLTQTKHLQTTSYIIISRENRIGG